MDEHEGEREPTVLAAARTGDPVAFDVLVAPYVRELRVHCYRMLANLGDAEDAVQETLLAAWRGLPGFEGRSSVRTWLYRIATHRCLNLLRSAARRRPAEPTPPFEPPEPSRRNEVTWLQPFPDALLAPLTHRGAGPEQAQQNHEKVELAFIVALQRLPPRQAATLLLRDVLGYSGADAAMVLGTSPTVIKGLLQRARTTLDHRPPGPHEPGSAQQRALARRFADAFTSDDIEGVLTLLTDDAWLSMPPAPHEYVGRAAIGGFLRASAAWRRPRRIRLVATRANTQPAFTCTLLAQDGSGEDPAGTIVLTVHEAGITGITRFLVPATAPAPRRTLHRGPGR